MSVMPFRTALLALLLTTSASAQTNLFPDTMRLSGYLNQPNFTAALDFKTAWTNLNGPIPGSINDPESVVVRSLTAQHDNPMCIKSGISWREHAVINKINYVVGSSGVVEKNDTTCALILPTFGIGQVTLSVNGTVLRIQSVNDSSLIWYFNPRTRTLGLNPAKVGAAAQTSATTTNSRQQATPAPSGSTQSANVAARLDNGLQPLKSSSGLIDQTNSQARTGTGRSCRPGTHDLGIRTWEGGMLDYVTAVTNSITPSDTRFRILSSKSDYTRATRDGGLAIWHITLLDLPTNDTIYLGILNLGSDLINETTVATQACRLD